MARTPAGRRLLPLVKAVLRHFAPFAAFGAVVIALLLAFGLVQAPRVARKRRLALEGVPTRGAVRDVGRVVLGDPHLVVQLTVDYRVAGRPYRVVDERRFFPPEFQGAQPGDSVPLVYLADTPAVAAVVPLDEEVCERRAGGRYCPR